MSKNPKKTLNIFNLVGEATASAYINKQESAKKQEASAAPTPVVKNAVQHDQLIV